MPVTPPPAVSRCPICRRPAQASHRPFCSERCRRVDLGHWLTGGYAIPGDEEPEEDEAGR